MERNPDVVIIGGGLAGLTAALHLSKEGLKVTLVEKNAYPRHKVCGEYVSNEILPYLQWLGVDVLALHPTKITDLEFTTARGKHVKARLPLGGFGISRYSFDNFLYQKAILNGFTIITETVTAVSFTGETFTVSCQNQVLITKIVLGAYGKRAHIDQILARDFIRKSAPWLAVKAHYSGNFPNDVVALHNFDGGYCGISKVENDKINVCYLADVNTFKKYKNIVDYQQHVLYKNAHLKSFFENSTLLFEKQITISQVSFDKKSTIEDHILMIGDTAGLIHPLCGNGMAMAMHGAKIASELILDYYSGKITSRQVLESAYARKWSQNFGKRLFVGRLLAKALQYETSTAFCVNLATRFPSLLSWIIKQTHGKPKENKWA